MHMSLVIIGGCLLLGVFALFGKRWGGDIADIAAGAKIWRSERHHIAAGVSR